MYAPLCGVWLANEIYEHYLNGGLDAERDTVLEIVRQAALFIMDYLVEHDGCYVSCPSASPEAVFDRNGRCALGLHSAFENGLARQALMNAASIVEEPSERTKIQNTLDHLQPFEYAQEGLSEWSGGISCSEKGHRHFSPLYALYPAGWPVRKIRSSFFKCGSCSIAVKRIVKGKSGGAPLGRSV